MTSPEPEVPPPLAERKFVLPDDNPVVAWAKAIALGLRDTAKDVLDEGRKGAKQAYNEGWDRFDAKTRYRRKPRS